MVIFPYQKINIECTVCAIDNVTENMFAGLLQPTATYITTL